MWKIVSVRKSFQLIPIHFRVLQSRRFCDPASSAGKGKEIATTSSNGGDTKDSGKEIATTSSNGGDTGDLQQVYRDLENLDFTKATKILVNHPNKRQKFGYDFIFVQLIIACLPSVAVYWVAMYARSEMKKMDAELAARKKKKEDKAREIEEAAEMEKMKKYRSEVVEVMERLQTLEKAVSEIAAETKRTKPDKDQSSSVSDPKQVSGSVTDEKKGQSTASSKEEK